MCYFPTSTKKKKEENSTSGTANKKMGSISGASTDFMLPSLVCVHGRLEAPDDFVRTFALECLQNGLLGERHECQEYHCPHEECNEVHRLMLVADVDKLGTPHTRRCTAHHFCYTAALRSAIKSGFGGAASRTALPELCKDPACLDPAGCSRLHLLPMSLRRLTTNKRKIRAGKLTAIPLVSDGSTTISSSLFAPTMAFLLSPSIGRICGVAASGAVCPSGFDCCEFHPHPRLCRNGAPDQGGMTLTQFLESCISLESLLDGARAFVQRSTAGLTVSKFHPNPCLPVIGTHETCGERKTWCKCWTSFVNALPLIADFSKVRFAYHGTKSTAAVRSILCEGLDVSRRAGQAYGPGEYFSTDAHLSFIYTNGLPGLVVFAVFESQLLSDPAGNGRVLVLNNPSNERRLCLPLGILGFSPRLQQDAADEAFFRDGFSCSCCSSTPPTSFS